MFANLWLLKLMTTTIDCASPQDGIWHLVFIYILYVYTCIYAYVCILNNSLLEISEINEFKYS